MSVPDNDLIAEVLLASEGFAAARTLAGKLVALFSLCREGLSRQQHYDWGLRALKTCLGAAGRLLRQVSKRIVVMPVGRMLCCWLAGVWLRWHTHDGWS
jgi:dynein heavy chain 2